jgi:hypothetical protein
MTKLFPRPRSEKEAPSGAAVEQFKFLGVRCQEKEVINVIDVISIILNQSATTI